ncbi:MAG: hypothetical protein HYS60_01305 [Candidatus Wildermuthbacteria bacterium]|nr:hypothetical protein [Candidatus Wildermuthbacteria bacterium]
MAILGSIDKKIFAALLILLLVLGGGIFLWNNQKDVRELNKSLPEGVKVTKSLIGDQYRVVNKIDGYEFGVPKAWGGLRNIDYKDTPVDIEPSPDAQFKEIVSTESLIGFDARKEWNGVMIKYYGLINNLELDIFVDELGSGITRKAMEKFGRNLSFRVDIVQEEPVPIKKLSIIVTTRTGLIIDPYTVFYIFGGGSDFYLSLDDEKTIQEIATNGIW